MTAQADYIAAVLADSPVAYYKLDDSSGQPQDSSGNAQHTTTARNSTNPAATYGLGGPRDGTTRAITTLDKAFVVPNPVMTVVDNLTIEAWVGSSTGTGGEPPVPVTACGANGSGGTPGGGADGYSIGVNASNHIGIDLHGGSGSPGLGSDPSDGLLTVWGSGAVRGNRTLGSPNILWSHCLVIRRAGTWEYWVDGQSESPSFGASFAPSTPTKETTIFNSHTSFHLTQYVCHVAYYNIALSSTRIAAHRAIMTAALQADYPFDSLLSPGGGTEYPASGRVELL
jgi:hypothetical protein